MDRGGLEKLLEELGPDSRRLRHALMLLCEGRWWSLADLVRHAATSRRALEALLREVELERWGDRFRVPPACAPGYRDLLPLTPPPADPVEHLLPRHGEVLARLEELVAKAPRARRQLDHVAATPETVLRRALLLGARFWLPGSRLLCVGDHDLTSLAVKLVHPEVDVTVVDVDDRILAYLDEQDLGVRTRWADLRLGLPPSARGHDLAFTDPPYTPEGVGLFVARAVEGIADEGRVLLAYGASERTPMLALKVQSSLSDLNLAYEAIYPDFNRYFGAEAIGSAADLYVLRPTSKTRPAVAARVETYGTAIYTHGPQSVEAAATGPVAVPAEFGEAAWDVLVGEWPRQLGAPRVKPATWLARPYQGRQERVAVALPPGMEAALPRVLLAAGAEHVRVWLAEPPRELERLRRALSPVFRLEARGSVVDAFRKPGPASDPAEEVARRILARGHGKMANAWREGIIAASGERRLTKNEARAVLREVAPWVADLTPVEAPLHRLEELPAAVRASLRTGRAGPG
ncbi:bis-aminopropyl spermidine synthase family protein [Thermoactinospora rubra]|uniref:bis-aminopropyl spermidine synthase family protein n=1 Tax=Thermoactinospora rubra TaxID=1088767 RepID=UPI0023E396F9|nr:bis-aminopropyl spermidine synthase family protein [Thermoactinospora rubra]